VHIDKVMTKEPQVVHPQTSLAYVAHMMVWEGIEVVPVVDEFMVLQGIITRQDVLKALQHVQRQPQIGETIEDIITGNLTTDKDATNYMTVVHAEMTNKLGTLSNSIFTSLVTEASTRLVESLNRGDLVVENITVYFIKPVPTDAELCIQPKILEIGRIYTKIDVEIYNEKKLVGKGLLMAQLIER